MNIPFPPPSFSILVVDDEPGIRLVLERSLMRQGYGLETAVDGRSALQLIARKNYDLILLDLHLGDMDGLSLLKAARDRDEDVVVIILTGQGSLQSAVEALRLGAFDYLFKPALPEAIHRRVRDGLQQRQQALHRRQVLAQIETLRQTLTQLEPPGQGVLPASNGRFLRSGPLVVDRHHRAATLNDTMLDLTTAEFDMLVSLMEAAPEPLTPRQLLNRALGYDGDELDASDTVKWHIHHLRRKVEPDPKHPTFIKTIRYKGYLWAIPAE
jgi:DNA-binding response OmpR family regulator